MRVTTCRQNLDIWVQAVGGGEAIQRTSESADETEPSFAPDGSQIVFSRRDAGIFVMGTLSGKPRLVAAVPWGRTPRLSPDGKWIVFWTGFPPSVVAGGIPEAVGSIHVVPSSGGESRVIETPLASERYPIWSPDGEYLLFLGEEDPDRKTHDWYVIPKDGGDPIKTGAIEALRAEGLGAGIPIPGGWRSQDNAVVLATNERESSNIWQIPISPPTGRLAGRPKRLTFGTAIERNQPRNLGLRPHRIRKCGRKRRCMEGRARREHRQGDRRDGARHREYCERCATKCQRRR